MGRFKVDAGEKFPHLYVAPAGDDSAAGDDFDIPDDVQSAHDAAVTALLAAERAIAQHLVATGQVNDRDDPWVHQL